MEDREEISRRFKFYRKELSQRKHNSEYGPPITISIRLDNYYASRIGKTESGHQFFNTDLFVPALGDNPGNEYLATFLFNMTGELVGSIVEEFGPRQQIDPKVLLEVKAKHLSDLGSTMFCDIKVRPFVVEHFGQLMGLIPHKSNEVWTVELLPGNFMSFREPWNSGDYDT